jgi:signal transduction histidine kinase
MSANQNLNTNSFRDESTHKPLRNSEDPLVKELEEEIRYLSLKLREAEQGKSDFLSNVRNEINNPLTSILGLTARMIEIGKDEKVSRLSRLVHHEVFELDYQMRNIFAASEVEAGEVKLLPSHVDILALIETQIQYLQPRTQVNNVKIQYINDSPPDTHFFTDASLLQTIIVNLLANAVEFSENNTVTIIRSKIEEDFLSIHVQDFGAGIDASLQKRIFERFQQLDSGSTKEHRGQGLGLAIVVEFVGMLGGGVSCDSHAKLGTIISIKLPALAAVSTSTNSTSFGNEILFNEGEQF